MYQLFEETLIEVLREEEIYRETVSRKEKIEIHTTEGL